MGDRARRALGRVAADARGDLASVSGRLRPAMLSRKLDHARQRLDQLWRVAVTLNPDAVLQRGLCARGTAQQWGNAFQCSKGPQGGGTDCALADGAVDVVTDGGKVEAESKPVKPPVTPGQAELF